MKLGNYWEVVREAQGTVELAQEALPSKRPRPAAQTDAGNHRQDGIVR
jgi:hypothetical protein